MKNIRKKVTALILTFVMTMMFLPVISVSSAGEVYETVEGIKWIRNDTGGAVIVGFKDPELLTGTTIPPTVAHKDDATIASVVRGIGDGAFADNRYPALDWVILPDTCESIGNAAFAGCISLSTIDLSDVDEIEEGAFYGCTGLESIVIPEDVTEINESTFEGCTGLETVDIQGNVTSIGEEAFMDCSDLTTINFPDTVTSIGQSAFENCSSLSNIDLPDDLISIGSNAFSGCTGLTSIVIPNSVTSIASDAFSGCSNDLIIYALADSPLAGTIGISTSSAITYENVDGWDNSANPDTYDHGVGASFAPLSRAGYIFEGWDRGSIGTGEMGPITITASWSIDRNYNPNPPIVPETTPKPAPSETASYIPSAVSDKPLSPPYLPGDAERFRANTGVVASLTVTDFGVMVYAGVNENGSLNSDSTAAAVKKAAQIVKANDGEGITLSVPSPATGISASTIKKLVNVAKGTPITAAITSSQNGKKVGNITLSITDQTAQIKTAINIGTNRTAQIENHIKNEFDIKALGSFETAQKGGWGETATLSINLEKLDFTAKNGDKLYAVIYDTETKDWFEEAATIKDGNVIIRTEHSGIFAIVTESGVVPVSNSKLAATIESLADKYALIYDEETDSWLNAKIELYGNDYIISTEEDGIIAIIKG